MTQPTAVGCGFVIDSDTRDSSPEIQPTRGYTQPNQAHTIRTYGVSAGNTRFHVTPWTDTIYCLQYRSYFLFFFLIKEDANNAVPSDYSGANTKYFVVSNGVERY